MKKSIFAITLAILLMLACLFVFAACGSDAATEAPEDDHDHNKEEADPCGGNHTVVIDAAREPTCTIAGSTEGKHCSVCNKTLLPQLSVAALGHDYVKGICSRCDHRLHSIGLTFTPNGDGSCYVSGMGTCTDTVLTIPSISPDNLVVSGIGAEAFMGIETITDIKLPASVKTISDRAFKNCSGLTELKIADTVTTIGKGAFSGCHKITSLTIGKAVTSIGTEAFANCHKMETIAVATGNTKYHVAQSCLIETASKTLVLGCKNSKIPTDGSVTSIGDGAFWGCLGLTNLSIPATVKTVGDGAFVGCTALTTVTVPASVTKLGNYAFLGCTALKSVTLANKTAPIGTQLFFNCTALATVNFQGTTAEWEALAKGNNWSYQIPATAVTCTNGSVALN